MENNETAVTFINLRWWSFYSINCRKYSTCACDEHVVQLAFAVCLLPATGANPALAFIQLALCGGGCVRWCLYVVLVCGNASRSVHRLY